LNPASIASRPWVRAAGIALLAAMVSLVRFTPAFVLWRGLGLPAVAADPALNRAADILRQLEHPFAAVAGPNNRVIAWRLLFPLVGHALALPGWLYLALPHLGCLLVLFFLARLLLRHGWGAGEALAATVLAATCSWFFVSMAWLGYFDSWYILALLLAVFGGRGALVAAVLAAPWIDERFVLSLPLALVLRDRYFAATAGPLPRARRWREAGICAAALLPWALVRLGAYMGRHDAVTGAYVQAMTPAANAPFYASGLWQGLRWAWVPVLAWLGREWRAGRRAGLVLLLVLGLTLAVNLLAANDLSRSASTAVPALVLGLVLLHLRRAERLRPLLYGACALNLVFPARHVVSSWTETISPLPIELDHARHPPPALDPDYYTHEGAALNDRGDPRGALELLDAALRLDPDRPEAHADRAVALFKLGRLPEAREDADRAVELRPAFFEALYNRAIIRASQGDFAGARGDLDAALRLAPAEWPLRARTGALRAQWDNLKR
jgi:tetratricopeptide (TPR) repeat protein